MPKLLEEPTTNAARAAATRAAANQLFNGQNLARYEEELGRGLSAVSKQVAGVDAPFTGITPAELRIEVAAVDLDQPLPTGAAALAEVERLYLRDAVYFHDVRYVAHLNCPVVIPALVGEALLTAVNSSMDTWDQSIGATLMERHLVDWTAGRLGLGPRADGVFTSGGSQSNLQALLVARNRVFDQMRREALPNELRLPDVLARLRIFTSQVSHFSIRTAASTLGLGFDAVVAVQTDAAKRMDVDALAVAIAECVEAGLVPMAVVATAGTTDFGSIDPLSEISGICSASGAWMHVDAAYGGGLLTSSRNRSRLNGIEHADSVTVDYHKTFFQPVSSSALIVRDGAMLGHVTHHADYLNPRTASMVVPNQVDKSIQTTRRFDALKLWLTLRTMGADGIGALLDAVIDLAQRTYLVLDRDPDFEVVVAPALSTLVFRYRPAAVAADGREDLIDKLNQHVRSALFGSGEAVVAGTTVAGRHYLKFTLLNAETTLADLEHVLGLIRHHGTRFLVAELEQAHV
ncbi:aspartate aminotransferase family protein [Cryobacterium sp. PH31-O1]|uniref:pyridoxal phosphate-dependent decarboxylase family protein n=1 Tax=Cryobacterium sp. PH31-O1 TaxID=3046306 RepID=UPI0024B924B9|nr:aspartate aminotransferase family protein [Cryobacterium sp. PH31-O1]MDJ0336848.1 aspartate aminotransferase family protein [Cryobacterium sp. PH31-O1]